LSVGLSGQSIFGTSEMLIKDFDCTVLVPDTIDISNDRYCNIYAWDGQRINGGKQKQSCNTVLLTSFQQHQSTMTQQR